MPLNTNNATSDLDLGNVTLRGPGRIEAGGYGTWTIVYTAGPHGLDEDGVIGLTWLFASDWGHPQWTHPTAPNYVRVEINGRANPELQFHRKGYRRPWWPLLSIRAVGAPLVAGDTLTVTLGDRSTGSLGQRAPTATDPRSKIRILVDVCGVGRFRPLKPDFQLTVRPGKAFRLACIAPSRVVRNEPLPVMVRVEDEWGNVVGDAEGEVQLCAKKSCGDNPQDGVSEVDLRETLPVNGDGGGVVRSTTLKLPDRGIWRIDARGLGLRAESNPIVVENEVAQGRRIMWGDLHSQTREALGLRPVEDHLKTAREASGLDFTGTQGNDFDLTISDWSKIKAATHECNASGGLVAFLGFEWSGNSAAGGDRNVVFLSDDGPLCRSGFWRDDPDGDERSLPLCAHVSQLYQFLNPDQALVIPHVGGRWANLDFHDTSLEPVVEVCSSWGFFEWFACEAMEKGLEVGFVGGTDDHKGKPGMFSYDGAIFAGGGGLTAVLGAERSRESIGRKIRERQCYATTGDRILLDVKAAGVGMGQHVRVHGEIEISCHVAGTAPIDRIELRRGAEVAGVVRAGVCASGEAPRWIRLSWTGVKPKRRYAKVEWHGRIHVAAFDSPGKDEPLPITFGNVQVQRESEHSWAFDSVTSGTDHSLWFPVSGAPSRVEFTSTVTDPVTLAPGDCEAIQQVRTDELWADVRIAAQTKRPSEKEMAASWRETPRSGRSAYWIKAMQCDGQVAVSSPIYVDAV